MSFKLFQITNCLLISNKVYHFVPLQRLYAQRSDIWCCLSSIWSLQRNLLYRKYQTLKYKIWECQLFLERRSNRQITVLFVIIYSTEIFSPLLTYSVFSSLQIKESLLIMIDKTSLNRNINSALLDLFDDDY